MAIKELWVENPVLDIINIVKDKVMDALRKVIDIVTEVFTKVSAGLSGMFNTVSSILYDVAKTLTKGGGYFVFFTFVNLLDLAIPINISKSSKLNVVMILLLSLVYIFIMYYALQFYYILPYVAVMLGLVIVPSYISMNSGSSEVPTPLQIEEKPLMEEINVQDK